jgi:hypothetical protein
MSGTLSDAWRRVEIIYKKIIFLLHESGMHRALRPTKCSSLFLTEDGVMKMKMNRLIERSAVAAAALMLAASAHAGIVTYAFTGSLTEGTDGTLDVPQLFSGHISFHDTTPDTDRNPLLGEYFNLDPEAEFETIIGDTHYIVHGGGGGQVDVHVFDDGGGNGAHLEDRYDFFATNQVISMGFDFIYSSSEIFSGDALPTAAPALPDLANGFALLVDGGPTFFGSIGSLTCVTCAPETSVPEPGTATLFGVGLLMLGYAVRRTRAKTLLAGMPAHGFA